MKTFLKLLGVFLLLMIITFAYWYLIWIYTGWIGTSINILIMVIGALYIRYGKVQDNV